MTTAVADERFTPIEAAEYLGIQAQTLAAWRCSGRYGLPFIKVGNSVRYSRVDLDAFLERRRTTCVSAAAAEE